jgi:hypothetical protein
MGEDQWEIRVQTPAGEIFHISEFRSEKEAESWLSSDRRRAWLRERGWEQWDIDPPFRPPGRKSADSGLGLDARTEVQWKRCFPVMHFLADVGLGP